MLCALLELSFSTVEGEEENKHQYGRETGEREGWEEWIEDWMNGLPWIERVKAEGRLY